MPQCAGTQSGHGATIAIELSPVSSPGVFTTIAQLNGDITIGLNRPETDVTSHNDDIDTLITEQPYPLGNSGEMR